MTEEESPAGILYFTRHYRLRDGQDDRRATGPGAGDLATSSSACSRPTTALLRHAGDPGDRDRAARRRREAEVFDAVCAEIPGCARWTDPARSEPASQVFAMGNLKSTWRQYRPMPGELLRARRCGGAPQIRSTAAAARPASCMRISARALDATSDPAARAEKFAADTRKALRPSTIPWCARTARRSGRAQNERDPDYKPSWRARAIKSLVEDAIGLRRAATSASCAPSAAPST